MLERDAPKDREERGEGRELMFRLLQCTNSERDNAEDECRPKDAVFRHDLDGRLIQGNDF